MSVALAIWTPPTLVSRRPLAVATEIHVPHVAAFMGRRERLHFAFLHAVKRIWIETGNTPSDCERVVADNLRGHVHWWRISCKHLLHRTLEMHLAEDDDLMAVVVPLAGRVLLESDLWPWYPDGWQELVRWAQAGCPFDAGDVQAAKLRVVNANVDRLAALPAVGTDSAFGRDEVVEHAGPLFGPPPTICDDLEAEIEAEWEES